MCVWRQVDWQKGVQDDQVDDRTARLLDILRRSGHEDEVPPGHPLPAAAKHPSPPEAQSERTGTETYGQAEVSHVAVDEGRRHAEFTSSGLSLQEGMPPLKYIRVPGVNSFAGDDHTDANSGVYPARGLAGSEKPGMFPAKASEVSLVTPYDARDNYLSSDEEVSSLSDISEDDEDILAQCISASKTSLDRPSSSSSDVQSSTQPEQPSPAAPASRSRLPVKVTPHSASAKSFKSPLAAETKKFTPEAKDSVPVTPASASATKPNSQSAKLPKPMHSKVPQREVAPVASSPSRSVSDSCSLTRTIAAQGSVRDVSEEISKRDARRFSRDQSSSPFLAETDSESDGEETELKTVAHKQTSHKPSVELSLEDDRLSARFSKSPNMTSSPQTIDGARDETRKPAQQQAIVRPVVHVEDVPVPSPDRQDLPPSAMKDSPDLFSITPGHAAVHADRSEVTGGHLSNGRTLTSLSSQRSGGQCVAAKEGGRVPVEAWREEDQYAEEESVASSSSEEEVKSRASCSSSSQEEDGSRSMAKRDVLVEGEESEDRTFVWALSQEGRHAAMSRSCSDTLDVDTPDRGSEVNAFGWCRKRQRSSDDIKPREKMEMRARSLSQDNFLKTQKNICNRIVQSTADVVHSNTISASHYAQACTRSLTRAGAPVLHDNRLLEHHSEPPMRQRTFTMPPSALPCFKDSAGLREKADSEKAFQDDTPLKLVTLEVFDDDDEADEEYYDDEDGDVDDEDDVADEEQDRTASEETETRDDTTTTEREEFDEDDEADNLDSHLDSLSTADISEDRRSFGSRLSPFPEEKGIVESTCSSLETEITSEDERLLQENANLIVSEIVTKRDMTGSAFDEDFLIENETLSLVSNEYTSDTESEVSVAWSNHSDNLSQIPVAQTPTTPTTPTTAVPGRPRIVKPGQGGQEKKPQEQEEGKGIRGRRKPLYSKPTPSTLKPPPRTELIRPRQGAGRGAASPVKGGGTNARQANTGTGTARPASAAGRGSSVPQRGSPRLQTGQAKSAPGPKVAAVQGTPKTSPTTRTSGVKPSGLKPPTPSRPGSASTKSPAKGNSAVPARQSTVARQGSRESSDRPKPPSKQGTFVKDAGVARTPDKAGTAVTHPRASSTSIPRGKLEKQNSGGTDRSKSANSPAEAPTKAVEPRSADSSQGSSPKQAQAPRNTKDTPSSPKTPSTTSKLQRPSNIARPVPGGSLSRSMDSRTSQASLSGPRSSMGTSITRSSLPTRAGVARSGSSTGLRKASLPSSPTKAAAGSVGGKGSGGSKIPSATAARADMRRSDSSASLRRGSASSGLSSPNGKRSSTLATARQDEAKKASGGQRHAPSKLSGMREERSQMGRSVSMEEPASTLTSPRPRNKSSSLPSSARTMSLSSMTVKKSSSVVSRSSDAGRMSEEEDSVSSADISIPKSSTYDKLPSVHLTVQGSSTDEGAATCDEDTSITSREGSPEQLDRSVKETHVASESMDGGNLEDDTDVEDDQDPSTVSCRSNVAVASSADSMDDSASDDLSSLSGTTSVIDSSTWRRKHHPFKGGDVSLELPNADETCRAVCTFLNVEDSQHETQAWQSCGSDLPRCHSSSSRKSTSEEKKSKSKLSVAKSIKSSLAGLKFFNTKHTRYQVKIEISKEPHSEPAFNYSPTTTGSFFESHTISVPPCKPSGGTIVAPVAPVAPFNYTPPSPSHTSPLAPVATTNPTTLTTTTTSPLIDVDPPVKESLVMKDPVLNDGGGRDPEEVVSKGEGEPAVHQTKTEMLLARRRQVYLNNARQNGDRKAVTPVGLVTTV